MASVTADTLKATGMVVEQPSFGVSVTVVVRRVTSRVRTVLRSGVSEMRAAGFGSNVERHLGRRRAGGRRDRDPARRAERKHARGGVVRWLAAGCPIGIAIEASEVRHSTSTSSANAPLSSSGVASSVTSVPAWKDPGAVSAIEAGGRGRMVSGTRRCR